MVTTTKAPVKQPESVEKAVTSIRSRLRVWITEEVEDLHEFELSTVADSATDYFLTDSEFVGTVLRDLLRAMAYEVTAGVAQRTRGFIVLGNHVASREGLKEQAKHLSGKWDRWLEHVGTRHLRLMDMTREDLLTAAAERRLRAKTENTIATLWETLAEKLEGGQVLRERFTPAEIDAAMESVQRIEATRAEFVARGSTPRPSKDKS